MESLKDNMMTISSDEFENNIMADAEEFSPAMQQQDCGTHKEWNEVSKLPADYIRREDMEIKDVAMKHVLPFLPGKSLMKFRAVSNEWNHWIVCPLLAFQQSTSFQKLSGYFYQVVDVDFQSDPNFLSLDHSANGIPNPSLGFLPERIKVLSSSSGLLLCQGLESYYVCNPLTKDWKRTPPHQYYHGSDPAVILAFDPQGNIESYFHLVAAVPLLDQPVVFFEIYSSQSNSWSRSSSECLELEDTTLVGGGLYMKGMAYWSTTSNDVAAVLRVPIPPGRYGALTQVMDELSYVTVNNDCGDVFMLDIYGGMDMSLNHSVCINLGHKKSCQTLEEDPFIDNGTVLCSVLPCINSGDDIVVICTTERIYLYYLSGQKVETFMTPGQLNPKRRFIPYTNSLAAIHDLKN
ncbi:F-box protein At5g07610-like [Solanum verrucosum]|uniref:F-box protein At5g07610-like n=1 Tax=Solanum verrucosum TaxID=315347 RepID=UPI0020D0FC53|nr:F-box protein At5g07610-like [Solanum verrucosum]